MKTYSPGRANARDLQISGLVTVLVFWLRIINKVLIQSEDCQ
jgi:hypothetical protein